MIDNSLRYDHSGSSDQDESTELDTDEKNNDSREQSPIPVNLD